MALKHMVQTIWTISRGQNLQKHPYVGLKSRCIIGYSQIGIYCTCIFFYYYYLLYISSLKIILIKQKWIINDLLIQII